MQEAILEILLLLAAKIDRHSPCFGQVTPCANQNQEDVVSALIAYQLVPLVHIVKRSPIVNAVAENANLDISEEEMGQIFNFLVTSCIPNIQLQLLLLVVISREFDHFSEILHSVCHLFSTTALGCVVHESPNQRRFSDRRVPHHNNL